MIRPFKHTPVEETGSDHNDLALKENNSLRFYLVVVALIVVVAWVGGSISYTNFRTAYLHEMEDILASITSLKISQLSYWRNERMDDAESLMSNNALSSLLARYLENRSDRQAQAQLQSWLDSLHVAHRYSAVYLFDSSGEGVLASPSSATYPEHLVVEIPPATLTNQVISLDFHRHSDGNAFYSEMVPIYSPEDKRVLGVVVLEADPRLDLFPYLGTWPVPSETAETLIVQREGDNVVFLNPLRFDPQAAMKLRIPLTETDVPAVMAVLGKTGMVEGVDYREQPVLAMIAPVPDSSWFIVARIDQAEVYAPVRQRLLMTIFFFGSLGLVATVGSGLLWRQQQLRFYQQRYLASERLRESEEKFRKVFLISPDAVSLSGLDDGKYIAINQAYEHLMGFTEEEALGRNSLELDLWVEPAEREKLIALLKSTGSLTGFEVQLRTKSGNIIQGLLSGAIVAFGGKAYIMKAIRDITERKHGEEETQQLLDQAERARRSLLSALEDQQRIRRQIAASEAQMRALFNAMSDVVIVYDRQGRYLEFAPTNPENPYLPPQEMHGQAVHEVLPIETADLIVATIQQALTSGRTEQCEYALRFNGDEIWYLANASAMDEDSVIWVARDITERKQAEDQIKQALGEKELLLRELYHRTKNTLNVIRSMLLLQAKGVPENQQVQKLVTDTESRIMAIALVHQKLYQSQDLSRISMEEYIHELAHLIMQGYAVTDQSISLIIDVEPLSMLLDTAIPCGLILNELLTNALKYAFPDGQRGQIAIRLSAGERGIITLQVSDNGVGVPPGFDFFTQETLGLQSIVMIAEHQLQGTVVFSANQGVTCQIQFKDTYYQPRI